MDNQQNHAGTEVPVAPGNPAPKTKKSAKPDPETFLENWRQALAGKKDPVPKLRTMARVGFQGEVKADQVAQLVASLAEHPTVAERLVLSLAVQERFAKLKPLAGRLVAEFRTSFESGINYDPMEFSGYRAPRAIEDWVAEHAPSTPASARDSWFRRFAVCLLNNTEPKTVLVGLVAASRKWASSKGLKSAKEDASFVRGIALALSPPAIGSNKVQLILAGVAAVEEQFRQMLNRELDLECQMRKQQEKIDALNKRVSDLEDSLAAALEDGEKKTARISKLEQSLSEAEERYHLLDRHWRGVSEQELTKQSGSFREKIGQELVEALLALDRENPNLEIVLRRLRRIQEILGR
jgi:archaellum component FlaC